MRSPSLHFLRSRRFWQKSAFALACLITLFAAAYAIENYRGRSAWKEYQREAAARGVKLRIEEFLEPPIPDEENFAALPLFQELQSSDEQVRERALASISVPSYSDSGLERVWRGGLGGRNAQEPLNFEDWRKIFLDHGLLESTTENAAEDILRGLNRYEPVLNTLRKEARERPKSQLKAGWEKGFGADFFRMRGLAELARLLSLRASTLLALGRSGEALEDWRVSYRLCEMLEGEPSLLAGLVRVMMLHLTLPPIWEGLAGHRWTEPQLAELEATLRSINLADEYTFMLKSERALINAALDAPAAHFLGGREPKGWALIPDGWLDQNKIRINQWFDQAIDQSRVPVPLGSLGNQRQSWHPRWWEWPYNFLKYATTLNLGSTSGSIVGTQTEVDLCRVACAIERHYLRTGSPPAHLEALVPSELSQVPKDPFSDAPLHYRVNPDGTCLLYSVDLDGKDDGGSHEKDSVWHWKPTASLDRLHPPSVASQTPMSR